MAITFGGLATGLDTKTLIEGLLAAERVPVTRLEGRRLLTQRRIDAFAALRPKVSTLETKAKELASATSFRSFSATSSDETFVGASATGKAVSGVYEIVVSQLAQNEIESSAGYADKSTTTVGTGTLSITVGGVLTQIPITSANNTLQGVANAVNDSDAKVSASIVNVGGAEPFKLVITADEAGDANTILVDASGLTGGGQALSFSETRTAQSALLTVNGLAIEATSNVVSAAIEGVTFTLRKETEAGFPINVTVNPDVGALKKKIQDFVGAYNAVVDQIAQNGSRNAATGETGILFGDFTANSIKRRISSLVSSTISTDDGVFNSLASIGISSDRNGKLTIDDADLTEALEDSPDSVIALFLDGDGGLAGSFASVASAIASATGDIVSRQNALKSGIKIFDAQIERLERRLERTEQQLTIRFAELEKFASSFQGLGALLQSRLDSLNR